VKEKPSTPYKVLIVDDSAVVRKTLKEIYSSDPELEVVGTAPDALIALRMLGKSNPDVISLDVQMPRMDGLTFLERLMKSNPMPVVMESALTTQGSKEALRSLELGAVDIVEKPKLGVKEALEEISIQICDKIKAAAQAKVKTPHQRFITPAKKFSADASLPAAASDTGITGQGNCHRVLYGQHNCLERSPCSITGRHAWHFNCSAYAESIHCVFCGKPEQGMPVECL